MKIISAVFCFCLVSSIAHAQIQYKYFKQAWCKCLPDSAAIETDTLVYRIESEKCKTLKYSKAHVFSEHQEYEFQKKNKVKIYESVGHMLREDYKGELHIERTYKTNASGDTIGVDSSYQMMVYSPGISNATFSYSTYKLNKSKNILILVDREKNKQYEILFLSSTLLLMRKIN